LSFRYLGSKLRLLESLKGHIGNYNGQGQFVDAFCGTGSVAKLASELGWPVKINDQLESGAVMAASQLISRKNVAFESLGGYEKTIDLLNSLAPVDGFFWREYSPASSSFIDIERKYFTECNAKKIDAISQKLSAWQNQDLLSDAELILLKSDLIRAVNKIANIAGTYGCFLSKWTKQSQADLTLKTQSLRSDETSFECSTKNVFDLQVDSNDLVYLDPPYTKRQYASYYHILETLVHFDEPNVEGVSGLRPWKDKSSEFCYKKKALGALTRLIKQLDSKKILLSYSSEGHVEINELIQNLIDVGTVEVFPLQKIGRYRPNKKASDNNNIVDEFLIVIEKMETKESLGSCKN
tara:strand:+ start:9651 stop:10706 length:1056 start_codon:yes stop_codon:yes gene_type:complete